MARVGSVEEPRHFEFLGRLRLLLLRYLGVL